MDKLEEEQYYKLYEELVEIVNITSGILRWYDFDKIKSYSVYIWTKATDQNDIDTWGRNLFDICSDEIMFYGEKHEVIDAAWPAIKEIQEQLLKIEKFTKKINIPIK